MKQWWNWRRREKELEKEIQHHLQMAAAEREERGASLRDARSGARCEFGNVGLVKEVTRDAWGWRWLEDLYEDLRYGLRVLGKNLAFTVAAVLAIALGVGINVGIFSVLNGIALRQLSIPRAEQVVSVNQVLHGHFPRDVPGEGGLVSYPEYLDYRDHNHVFDGLIGYEPFVEATMTGPRMEQLLGVLTSCNFFDVLEEHPAEGRGFIDSDCAAPGANPVVVISDDLWRRDFAGDRSLVGKAVILNQTSYTVIGVAPPRFTGTEVIPTAFWVPITMQAALDPGRDFLKDDNVSWLAMLGRVRPGVTMAQVRADLSVIAGRIDQPHPGRTTSLLISRATFFGRPEEREILVPIASVVLAAFGLVLLIACANVSNLLLARASARHKEIALRLSIGASRWRLVRQLLTESLLLSLIGGALGSLLAFWSFASITHLVTSQLPHEFAALSVNVAPDFRVLAYALVLTLASGIAFGLIPALESSRLDLNTALKGDGAQAGRGKKSGRFLRNALVGAQIAVCMVLLLAAGLLLRGLYYAQTLDPGFAMRNVAGAFFNLRTQGYDENRAAAFIRSLGERLAGIPGVVEVAEAECAPLSHDFSAGTMTVPGRAGKVWIEYNHVSPEFFSVVGIPIVRGRSFTQADARNDATAIVVTESTARRLWPSEDPLGKTLRDDTGGEYSVIGVAKDAQVSHLGELDTTYLYFPAGPQDNHRIYVLVRFAGGYTEAAKGIRDAVQSLDANMPVDVVKLEDYLDVWRVPSRIASALSGALGGLALLLASIGVYGMVSYSVSRSVREIGIRMALGAAGAEVMSLVLRQAMRPVLIGGIVGVAGCAAVSWVLSSMLFGLSAHDPVAFVSVPLFLLVVALIASYVPARRATRVDPVVALRYE
jgi:macrolide transport system ATP-binding/permease protein